VDFDLSFNKTLSRKNGSMGWGPGSAIGDQISKHALCLTLFPESPKSKAKKIFFRFQLEEWIRRGFEQLSRSIAWRVIGLQISAKSGFCGT